MRVYNFGSSGRNFTKFYQRMWLIAGVIKWALILQGVPPTKFGRVKNVQTSARFLTTFEFDQEWIDIPKIRKVLDQLHFIPYWAKKLVKFGPLPTKL